jgi:glucose-6-phosphate isomerase
LHSLGQFYQDGTNIIFETVISINNTCELYIPKYQKAMDTINNIAAHKVAEAHYQTGTYSNYIDIDILNPYNLGDLIYFFEIAAATGGYLLDVYPFDQPGVNAYKNLISKELDNNDTNH